MKKPLLILSALLIGIFATACGSISEIRKTYNLDGTIREEVTVKIRSNFTRSGLAGFSYTITSGNDSDLHRSLTIDSVERDVSTNAAPAIKAIGEGAGNLIGAAGSAFIKP